jgi:hypothetical protein
MDTLPACGPMRGNRNYQMELLFLGNVNADGAAPEQRRGFVEAS